LIRYFRLCVIVGLHCNSCYKAEVRAMKSTEKKPTKLKVKVRRKLGPRKSKTGRGR
jgi:hypothetical protein